MAVTHTYGKVSVKYNELSSIIIETKGGDGYIWNDVTFKEDNKEKEILLVHFMITIMDVVENGWNIMKTTLFY